MLLSLLLWITSSYAEPCTAPVPIAALRAEVSVGLEAWEGLDARGLQGAAARVRDLLPCVDAPLAASDASAVHLLEGVARYSARPDLDAVRADLAAARASDPTSQWSIRLFPEGSPLALAWASAPLDGVAAAVPAIAGAVIHVDGRPALARVMERPAIVQRLDEGRVTATARLAPGADWPTAFQPPLNARPTALEQANQPRNEPPRPSAKRALAATAISSAVLSLVGFGVATGTAASWGAREENHTSELRLANRVSFASMIGFGGVAIGTGIAAIVTPAGPR